jgi:hypothetical protein
MRTLWAASLYGAETRQGRVDLTGNGCRRDGALAATGLNRDLPDSMGSYDRPLSGTDPWTRVDTARARPEPV